MNGSARIVGTLGLGLLVALIALALAGSAPAVGAGVVTVVGLTAFTVQRRIQRTSSPERVPPWVR